MTPSPSRLQEGRARPASPARRRGTSKALVILGLLLLALAALLYPLGLYFSPGTKDHTEYIERIPPVIIRAADRQPTPPPSPSQARPAGARPTPSGQAARPARRESESAAFVHDGEGVASTSAGDARGQTPRTRTESRTVEDSSRRTLLPSHASPTFLAVSFAPDSARTVEPAAQATARQATPTPLASPSPVGAAKEDRPGFLRRIWRFVQRLFGGGGKRGGVRASLPNSTPTISSVSFPASRLTPPPNCAADARVQDNCSASAMSVAVAVNASDANGDQLSYEYEPTGGRVTGSGPNVTWDLSGAKPGRYVLNVAVRDPVSVARSEASLTVEAPCPCIPQPPRACPTVRANGPDVVRAGESINFTVTTEGGDPSSTPTYSWTVSAGTIISGQGTPSILVDTTGVFNREVTATAHCGGYAPSCPTGASITTNIARADDLPPLLSLRGAVGGGGSGGGRGGIPGVSVTATSSDGRITRTTRTDSAGRFAFDGLPPGTYLLTVRGEGFETTTRSVELVDAVTDNAVTISLVAGTSATPTPSPTPGASPTPTLDGQPSAAATAADLHSADADEGAERAGRA